MSTAGPGPGPSSSASASAANYRQEIRGVLLLNQDGVGAGGLPKSSPGGGGVSCAVPAACIASDQQHPHHPHPPPHHPPHHPPQHHHSHGSSPSSTISSSLSSSSTTGSQQQPSHQHNNRLSRLPSQLQQQHVKNMWKHYLYELQQKAPTPKRIICRYNITSRPAYYGREFHGIMTRNEADQLLLEDTDATGNTDGRYLVRESARTKNQMTLSLRFGGVTKNFRLFYTPQDGGKHYVNEMKRFDTLHDLVADGLITLYVESHGADYIANLANQCRYEESPYMTLHKTRLAVQNRHFGGGGGSVVVPIRSTSSASSSSSSSHQLTKHSNRASTGSMGQLLHQQSQQQQNSSSASAPSTSVFAAAGPSGGKRRSHAFGTDGGGIRMITNHEELSAPDEEIYEQPCGGIGGVINPCANVPGAGAINIQAIEKAHQFRTHTFIGNPWCDFCGNFIWGLIGQGVRCEDCGFGAHRKCSELIPNDCCPDLRHIRRIFGIDLTTFVKASNSLRPFVVDLLVAEVERRGMTMEGIYRACGSVDEIEALKNRFESEWEQADTYLRSVEDIHVITGALKLYLRLLPIPLITFDSYANFIEAVKRNTPEIMLNGLRDATAILPPAHYQTLKFLITHLNRVTIHEHRNLMSAKNLSLIFGQTLLYTPNIPMMFQANCWEVEAKVVEMLILNCCKIFSK